MFVRQLPARFKDRACIHRSLNCNHLWFLNGKWAEFVIGFVYGKFKPQAAINNAEPHPFTAAQCAELQAHLTQSHAGGQNAELIAMYFALRDVPGTNVSLVRDADYCGVIHTLACKSPIPTGSAGLGSIVAAALLALGYPNSVVIPAWVFAIPPRAYFELHSACNGLADLPDTHAPFVFQAARSDSMTHMQLAWHLLKTPLVTACIS